MVPITPEIEAVGRDVVDAAVRVHKAMGPGLLECVYEECMFHELSTNRGLRVERQVEFPIRYDGVSLQSRLRLDLLVERCVVLELKAVESAVPLYEAQLISYLRLTGLRLGFLINFNVPLVKTGIKRMIL
jgi:GxxExxY protein